MKSRVFYLSSFLERAKLRFFLFLYQELCAVTMLNALLHLLGYRSLLWSLVAVKIKPAQLQCIFIRVLDIEMQNKFKCKESQMISCKPSAHKGLT